MRTAAFLVGTCSPGLPRWSANFAVGAFDVFFLASPGEKGYGTAAQNATGELRRYWAASGSSPLPIVPPPAGCGYTGVRSPGLACRQGRLAAIPTFVEPLASPQLSRSAATHYGSLTPCTTWMQAWAGGTRCAHRRRWTRVMDGAGGRPRPTLSFAEAASPLRSSGFPSLQTVASIRTSCRFASGRLSDKCDRLPVPTAAR